jgi:CRP-like cAMP-binding protein
MNPMVESLRSVPLFADFTPRDLKRLADSMKQRSFASGDEVVAEGKGGVGFFVILEGTARVSQNGEDRGRLTAGEYFGEMALIDGNLRLASVHAEGDLRCATMTSWNFRPFVRDHPDVAWALLTAMVKRVREAQPAPRVVAAG